MSLNTAEKVLWLVGNDPAHAVRLRADAPGYLAGFRLDEAERRMIGALDVAGLARHGVNPFLTMYLYQAMKGPDGMGEYMQRMNQPPTEAAA